MSESPAKLDKEKMIYVNDKMIPVDNDFLTSRQILEIAGFAPEQYSLYIQTGKTPNDYHGVEEDKTPIEIQNGLQFRAVPKPTSQV
ncbi:MAG: hypothetical protein M3299_08815 [Thermoproteota archaeon]|nr:hypothetical protein [Thermoproteota archaeon]